MIALPNGFGVAGALLLVLGAALGAGMFLISWRRLRSALAHGGEAASAAAALVAGTLALSAAVAPVLSWRIVQDLRYTTRIPEHIAERIGAYESGLDGSVFDQAAALMPADARYYVDGEGSDTDTFEAWSRTALLPRIAVSDPRSAEWIFTMGLSPARLGVELVSLRLMPTSYGEGAPPTYLAEVAP